MKKRIALIPAYKPNIQLLEFVKGIEEHGMDCLIVNDGSGEAYLSLFHKIERETEARVLSFPENRGKGAALKAGLEYLQKENVGLQGDFTLITLDADGQHLLKDALNLLSVAEEKKRYSDSWQQNPVQGFSPSFQNRKQHYQRGVSSLHRGGSKGYPDRDESIFRKDDSGNVGYSGGTL